MQDEPSVDDVSAHERGDDYNVMMLHIQTLISNTKAGNNHHIRLDGDRIHHQEMDLEEVDEVPLTPAKVLSRLQPMSNDDDEDDSDYILDNEEELQQCSDESESYDGFSSCSTDDDNDGSGSDFGDIVPLTPMKKAPTNSGRGSRVISDDDASFHFFPLSHMCGPHFTGAFPVDYHGGEELQTPELSSISSSNPPSPQASLKQLEVTLAARLKGLMGNEKSATVLLKQVDTLLSSINGTDEDRDGNALESAKEMIAKAGGHELLDNDEVVSLLALCAQKVFFTEQARNGAPLPN
eukprot:TRINITY_DN6639_c0_g1_i3.p1 TRINITY_DN6639_c0_g1~~TRINITY_DN6639_c0_g1_i3.p1  ORF type:complete len:294 (+),score=89.36 TRINITY_DN6639_c0_g1_i3:258-1139(+)